MVGQIKIDQNTYPTEPTLKDTFDMHRKGIFISLNCHAIATIESFNPLTQQATATMNYKRTLFVLNPVTQQYDTKLEDYPVLVDCPVICLGGGGAALTFPISEGDECLVLFNDRDIDKWFSGASNAGVNTQRMHSFADGILLVGLRSLPNVLTAYDSERVVLRKGAYKVAIGADGIDIANATNHLGAVLTELTDQLKALTDAIKLITVPVPALGTSGVPLNAASFTAIAVQIDLVAAKIAGILV